MYPCASNRDQSDILPVENRNRVQALGVIRADRKKSGPGLIHHDRLTHGTIGETRIARETLYRLHQKGTE